ncbi:MAG: vWA domain-containing protein [Methylophagaceae bacterium]
MFHMASPKGVTNNTKNTGKYQCEVGFETDPKLDTLVREKLIQARVSLLIKQPFFGNLATRLKLINGDEWLPTAATDGRNFYYNTRFINELSVGETMFLFGHEVLHVVYDHMGRFDGRDKQLANIAADYCVNGDLIRNGIGTTITTVDIIHDRKYYDWSFEEVYDDLYENAEKIDISELLSKVLDDHLEDGDGDGKDSESGKDGKPSKGTGRPKLTAEEKRQIKEEMKEAVMSAAQSAGAGNVPANIKRMISEWTQPKIDWRSLLQQQIQSTIKSDFTFMRPNRKSWHIDAVLPGMNNDEKVDVCIGVDMSGSISNVMVKDFFSEIKGIMDQYQDFSIKIGCVDTSVYNHAEFDPSKIDELLEYEPHGGGGTDFDANWNYMKDEGIEPKKFIMFTDGYPFGSWGDELYCDTVFIIHGNDQIVPPFGTHAYYEEEVKKAA